jgi:hypothetical protein
MVEGSENIYSEVGSPSIPSTLGHSDVLSVQDIEESSVSRLLLIAVVPEQSRSFTGKRSWDPAVSVLDTLHRQLASTSFSNNRRRCTYPDGNTNTARNVDAALSDTSPSRSCNSLLARVARCVGANVEFSVRNVNTEISIVLQRLRQDCNAGGRSVLCSG